MGSRFTRRQALETAGVAALGGVLGMASNAVAEQGWTRVDSPTGNTINAVEHTAHGLYACGVGGEVHARRKGKWKTEIKRGPSKNSRTLTDADTTTDGNRFWVVGNSGAVGEYRPDWRNLYDHSNPLGISNEFTSVSVTGEVGSERIYIGQTSGQVIVGTRTGDDSFDWTVTDTGSGYTVLGTDFTFGPLEGYVSTDGSEVYRTEDGGDSWTQVGVPDGQTSYTAILADDETTPNHVFVGGGGGRIWRLDCDCGVWTPTEADTKRVYALDANSEGGRFLGAGASGQYYEPTEDRGGWEAFGTPTGNSLYGAAPADTTSGVDVLVGGSGTILER